MRIIYEELFLIYSFMFKVVIICLIVPALLILLSGCSLQTQGASDSTNGDAKLNQIPQVKSPEREADISGTVKSIVGNEVVITQVDMEAIHEQMTTNMPEGAEAERPAGNNFVASGGQPPSGGGGTGMAGGRGFGGDENSAMRDQMNELMRQYSLGDVKVLIPVGIPMYARGGEVSLADVVVGSNLTVWLNQDSGDRKIAEFVNLR